MVERIGNEEGIEFGANVEAAEPILVAQANTGTVEQPAAAPLAVTAPVETVVEVGQNLVLQLPDGTSIDQPRLNGTNLEFVQADGSVIVVPNGAIQGLTILIGSVEIPPLTVAALFEASNIQTAAGPAGAGASSSGGNFEVPVGGIGDAFDIGNLLDPTELAFGTPDFEELRPANTRPRFGSDLFGLDVSEEGLSFGIPDANPAGSDTTDNAYFLVNLGAFDPDGDSLTFTFGQPNATLFSNGQQVVWEGVGTDHLVGRVGSVTVIDITVGGPTGIVFVRLMQPIDHPAQGEDVVRFGLTVTADDGRGGTATTTLNIGIEDDSPVIGTSTSVSVDEDGLSNGVNNTDSPGDNNDANRISATGSLNIRWGADNGDAADGLNADGSFAQDSVGRAVYFSQADFDAFVLANGGLKSGGNGLTFTLTGNGTIITAYTAGGEGAESTPVFRISLSDDGAGQYKFQLLGQLDHPRTSDGESESSTGGFEDDIVLNLNFTAKDADGDLANGKFSVVIDDDMPVVKIVTTESAVTHDESAWPQNPIWSKFGPSGDKDDDDVGVVASILRVSQYFSGVANTGDDADVSTLAKLAFHGAIGYAESNKALISVDVAFGADGPAASNSLVYSLVLGTAASSGLKTTEGQPIYLVLENGIVVGRVGGSEGPAAIALYVDADTGKVTIAQWLSLQHDNINSHDEFTSLVQGAVLVKVTATDGDGDSASASADISTQVRFEDDGPTLEWFSVRSKVSISHDETPGVDSDANDTSADVSSLFAGIVGGDDPHVAGTGAIGYAQVSGNSLFSIGVDFGSDGKHSTNAYKFALSIGEATTALKTTEGNAIRLELDGSGRIVGVVVGGAFNGQAAFALHIDPATGNVTLAQYLSLQHNNTGSHDESIWLAANNVRVTLTVTDGDGDTDSKFVNIGSKIGFQDDGPSVVVSANGNSTVTHDESPGPQNAVWNWFGPSGDHDDDDVGIIASIAKVSGLFSGVTNHGDDPDVSDLDKLFFKGAIGYAQSDNPLVSYTANFGADGAATTGSVKYSLVLSNEASGLKTTDGDGIVLKLVGGLIIGEVVSGPFQGQAAFALHIDQQTGKVTMAQWLSLEHGSNPTQHDDAISLAQGSVSVKVTVEDRDGDTHSHSADVSNQIRFEDDGPTLEKFRVKANAQIVHDETPGLQGDDTNANVSGLFAGLGTAMGHAAVAGTSLFSISASFGSDGKPQGETGYTFKLSVGQATTSLKTVDGQDIKLFLEDGLIVGRIGSGEAAFAIHIDAATGNVTLAQYLPVKHVAGDHDDVRFLAANNIKVTLTVTDGDGDTVTSKAVSIGDKIGFRDDGPDAVVDGSVALPVLTVDESNGAGSGQDGKLVASANFADNFGTVIKYGADGAGSVGYALKLVGTNVGSGLYAVDASATDGKGSEILLSQTGGVVTGSLGGVDYFTIAVDASGKVTFTLTGQAPVWHANTGSHDDASTLEVAANKLLLTQTVTDADGDKDSASIDIGSTGVFSVEDDGPTLTIAPANGLSNGLFFSGFTSNSPEWGQGSGYTSGTAGAWTITSSTNGGSGSTELQRVGDGYRGADSPTDSLMVDLEASPGNVAITQQISGLTSGELYRLSFEIGAASDASIPGTARLEVFWNGVSVGIYDPTSGVMQTQVLNLVAQAGNNTLTFQEIGAAGDNTGTFLANVQITDLIIIIDESANIQPDSDEVDGASVAALFNGLQAGVDPHMAPQYAQGSGAIVAPTVNYGADGQGAALAYAFNITAGATSLKTTEGQVISLALDGGRVVGTYMDGGVSKVAFALHVNGATGVVTVAQFVSLEHPIPGSSHDEGLYLPAGSVRVSVTATDGDGDTATASSDITGLIRFEDDGPQTSAATFTALGAELIKNGGFEDGHNLGSGSNWNLFNSIDHWTKSGNIPFEVQTGNAGGTGNHSAVVELDGDSESQGGAAPSTDGTNASIEQLVQGLVAGQTYQLSFGYAPRTTGDVSTAGLEVWFGNKLVFPVGNATYPANAWTTVTITVTATGEDAILKFVGTGAEDEFGALIDDVSLRASYGGLDDDSQPHGNPGGIDDDADGKMLVGNLNINAGADGLKSIVFDDAAKAPFKAIWLDNDGVGHQMDVKLVWEPAADGGGVLRGTMEVNGQPVPVLTLTVGKDGSFTLTMHAPLVHAEPGAVPNNEDNLLLNLGYTVTDGDFDTARGTLSVTVDDDTPVAVATSVSATVKEADVNGGGAEVVPVGFNFTGVNPPTQAVANNGISIGVNEGISHGQAFGTQIVLKADVGQTFSVSGLDIGLNGSYAVKYVVFTATDINGVTATFNVNVAFVHPIGSSMSALVTANTPLDPVFATSLSSGFDPLHLTSVVISRAPGSADRVIIDNVEVAKNVAIQVVPAEIALDLSTLVNFGADGAHADGGFQIRDLAKTAFGTNTSEGDQVFVKAANGVLTGYTDDNAKLFTLEIVNGKAVFKLYGEFDHTSQSNLLNLDFGRFITAVDGDGDGVLLNAGAVIITIEDANRVPTAGEVKASVDDDGLPGGNPAAATGDIVVAHPAGATEATFAGTLQGAGGDGALTFSFANMAGKPGTIGQETVKYNWDSASNTLTAEITSGARLGQSLFTVVLNPVSGAYTLTLINPVLHTAGDNTEASVFGELSYTVSDSDANTSAADTATGTLTIEFNDDVPTASNATVVALSEGYFAGGTFQFAQGADGAQLTHINDVAVGAFDSNGWSSWIVLSSGSIRVKATGEYQYQARADDAYVQGTESVTGTFTVTDADGDKSTATFGFTVSDDKDATVVTLHDVTVDEGSGTATISATIGMPVTGSPLVITLSNNATITIAVGQTTGTSTPFAVQGDDVYVDHESYEVSVTGVSGGNYESLNVTDKATVTINDTIDVTTVTLTASSVTEGDGASYTFTATLSHASRGVTTITTDQGVITITDGETVGTLVIAANNGEDVYKDASSLTAKITAVSGGSFEKLEGVGGEATAHITDTTTPVTFTLVGSSVTEGTGASYTFTATLSSASQGTTTITTDRGDIVIANGQTVGTLVIAAGNGDDVYKDPSNLTATVTAVSGGNFEQINGVGTQATASVTDTINTVTATLTAGTAVPVDGGLTITYTITLSGGPGAIGPNSGTPLVFTLSDGTTQITIDPVTATGSATVTYPYSSLPGLTVTNGIASHTGGAEYEDLASTGSTSVAVEKPLLIIGSSGDDVTGSSLDHTIANPNTSGEGVIQGGGLNDIIAGDPGAVPTVGKGDSANLVFVLDTSGSMSSSINFGGSSISRLEALQKAVIAAIDELSSSGADNVRIHLVQFNDAGGPGITFDLITNGIKNQAQIDAAKAVVSGTDDTYWSSASTNYESALQQVQSWIAGDSVSYSVNGGEAFDSGSASGTQRSVLLDSYLTKIAVVSAWTNGGTTLASVAGTTGGMGLSGSGDDLDQGQMLRFDFGAEDNYGIAGFDPSPTTGNTGFGTQFADFNGPAVEFARFVVSGIDTRNEAISYKVYYTNGSFDQAVSVTANGAFTLGTDGKTIAYVEILGTGTSNSGVTVRLDRITIDHDGPLAGSNINKVIFISDGEPNAGGTFGDEVISIENNFGPIEAIGINVGGNALSNLNAVEGAGGSATNITTTDQLIQAIGELAGGALIPAQLGGDTINGNAGNDIIFGDVMNTDKLADAKGLTAIKDGSGWQVFNQLETNQIGGWTRADTLAYIRSHVFELSLEMTVDGAAVRKGGDDVINGGSGNDLIFAQEGNDTIFYSWDGGRDFVHGGTHKLDANGTPIADLDTLNLDISGATSAVYIETVAAYNLRMGPDYDPASNPLFAGTDWATSGIDWNSLILVSDADGNIHLELYEIEQINVTGNGSSETIFISGDFVGTQLSTNTIYVDTKGGDDTLDLTGRDSGHRVVADGGDNNDTVKLDFKTSEITSITSSGNTVSISHNGITDVFTNFENFLFEGDTSTRSFADVLTIDYIAPTVQSISYGTNDGVLALSEQVTLTVKFSEAVIVDATGGVPALNLNSGGTATYVSGSGTDSLVFVYTPGAGQSATDLALTASGISLNNGIITDASGNNANLTAANGYNPATTLRVDTTAPTVTLSSTITTDTGASSTISSGGVTKDNTLRLSGTVSDAGGSGVSSVQIYDGSTLLGTAAVTNGTWNYTTSALGSGTHSFTAKATDVAGNVSETAPVTATVDTTAPTLTINTSIITDTGASGSINSGGLTKDNTLLLSGTVSDANGVASVQVYNGTTLLGTAAVSNGSWTFTTSALSSGTYTFTAKATDTAGNTVTSATSVAAIVDTTAPTVTMTNEIGTNTGIVPSISGGGTTKDNTLSLKGTVSDTNGVAAVQIYDGATLLGTATVTNGNWTFTTLALNDGAHSFTAVAIDNAGNQTTSTARTATIDTIAPSDIVFTGNTSLTANNSSISNNSTLMTLTSPTETTGPSFSFNGQGSQTVNINGNETLTISNGGVVTTSRLDFTTVQTVTLTTPTATDAVGNSQSETVTLILGSQGNGGDTITGATGNSNVIYGFGGNDTIIGGNEDDWISGGVGNDILNGGGGNDILIGGVGADTMTGGAGSDIFEFDAGDTVLTIGGSGMNGTLSGFDVITDFAPGLNAAGSEKLRFTGLTMNIAGNTASTTGDASTLRMNTNATVKSHAISNGIITFDDATNFSTAVKLNSIADVAAVAQYLLRNFTSSGGPTLAFLATIDGVEHTFVYRQSNSTANAVLIDLVKVSATSLSLSGVDISVVGTRDADPIILDLDHNGFTFSDAAAGAAFDINGDGHKDQVAWNTSSDGILAMDLNGNGAIDDGNEIFTPNFGGGDFASGADALASLDTNNDGVIDEKDDAFSKLLVWQDANANGISEAGELRSLADHGIASISVKTTSAAGEIDGQQVVGEGTFTRTDGTTGSFVEVDLDAGFGGPSFLVGTDGDDIIIGGLGNDTLTGGAGADTFVFSEAGPENADTITDFVTGEDTIDLGALLDAALIDADNVGDYVRVQDTGADALLQVNTAGTGDNWVDVATLTGHGNPGTVIDLKIDDEHHTVQIPTI